MENTGYAMTRQLPGVDYEDAVERTRSALAGQGFGVLTEIDVKATLKKKLDAEFRRYIILGACNPPLAHEALTAEPLIGLLLPCNVVVAEEENGGSVVAIASPRAMFSLVQRREMESLVDRVESLLVAALEAV